MVTLTIDGKRVRARQGDKVLWTALANGIYVPNLCALQEDVEPFAACRLCFVEVKGKPKPVTACTEIVADGMTVNTRSTKALRLARSGLDLILASHLIDCSHCVTKHACELLRIAAHLGMKLNSRRLPDIPREMPADESHPEFSYYPAKCVLCDKCLRISREQAPSDIGFAWRGFDRRVATFGNMPLAKAAGANFKVCVAICPTGALAFKGEQSKRRPTANR